MHDVRMSGIQVSSCTRPQLTGCLHYAQSGQEWELVWWMQIVSGNLEMDTKLISDCLMSLALFEAWQEPLYLHLVNQAHALPLAAYGPKSLRQTYQVDIP